MERALCDENGLGSVFIVFPAQAGIQTGVETGTAFRWIGCAELAFPAFAGMTREEKALGPLHHAASRRGPPPRSGEEL